MNKKTKYSLKNTIIYKTKKLSAKNTESFLRYLYLLLKLHII